jgi:hypothetical protein
MVVMYGLLPRLLCRDGCRLRIEGLRDVVGWRVGRGSLGELERLEQIVELIVVVVTLHIGSSSPLVSERVFLVVCAVLCHE